MGTLEQIRQARPLTTDPAALLSGAMMVEALVQQLRRRGKGHHAALCVLAFKWIRILFHCWKTRTGYDEQIYLKSRQKRNPTLWAEIQLLPPRKKKVA